MVTCQNNPNHNKTFTELPTDSYEISAPALNKDTYECTVTITADSYIGQMAGDHKIVDGTPDSKKVLLAYVNDQWIVANEEEATVSFLAECVAPEAPRQHHCGRSAEGCYGHLRRAQQQDLRY